MISIKLVTVLLFAVYCVNVTLANQCPEKFGYEAVFVNKAPYDSVTVFKTNVTRLQCMTECLALYGANCRAFFYNEGSQICQMYDRPDTCIKLVEETDTKGFVEVINSSVSLVECLLYDDGIRSFNIPGLAGPVQGHFSSMGWLTIQRRTDGSLNFSTTFLDYEKGFGNLTNEFWFGNKYVYLLTSQVPYEIQIEVTTASETVIRRYSNFSLSSSADRYRLSVVATDNFADSNNQRFTTLYEDNDSHSSLNCAQEYGAGWWYASCGGVFLNGRAPCRASFCSMFSTGELTIYNPDRTVISIRPMDPSTYWWSFA